MTNTASVNPQMQQLAESAVVAARDKFGISLDFTENSLKQLDTLLQQAHEGYKQTSNSENLPNIPIDNTVRVWGSYFGEVIRRSLGGDWIVDQNNVYLQLGSQRLNPLGQVRSWIKIGTQHNIQGYFDKLSKAPEQYYPQLENEPLAQQPINGNEPSIQTAQSSGNKCPLCGSEYQGAYCPKCGNGLINISPEVYPDNRLKKQQIAIQIASTEIEIGKTKTRIQDVDNDIRMSAKGSGNAGLMVFIGVLLIPIGIGIILVIGGVIGMIVNPIESGKKQKERAELVIYLEKLHKKLIYLKGSYAIV